MEKATNFVRMKNYLLILFKQFKSVLEMLFPADGGPMSNEVRDIFSNPEDKKKYIDGVNKFNSDTTLTDITMEFSGGKKITLIR